MNFIFELFSKNTLQQLWTFTPGALIWRILYGGSGKIVGECRQTEKKMTSFFCLDAKTGIPFWNNLRLDDQWWVGIETIHQNKVLFHHYAKPDMPEHRGIEARDIETGTLIWKNNDLAFWFASENKVCAYRDLFEKRITYYLDAQNGEIIEEIVDIDTVRNETQKHNEEESMQFPVPLDVEADSQIITSTLKKRYTADIVFSSTECIETDMHWVIGFCIKEKQGKGYSSYMSVIRRRDLNVMYSQILGHDHPVPAPDLFFIAKDILYFVIDQQTLAALELWKS